MKASIISVLFLSLGAYASSKPEQESSEQDPAATNEAQASASFSAHLESLKDLPKQKHYLSPALQQFIFELNGFDHDEYLAKRQAAGGLGGGAGIVDPATLPTQAPTITSFVLNGTPIPYTQKFSATPDQWEGPKVGTIGLGSHKGQIGVVKTRNK